MKFQNVRSTDETHESECVVDTLASNQWGDIDAGFDVIVANACDMAATFCGSHTPNNTQATMLLTSESDSAVASLAHESGELATVPGLGF